MPKDYEVVVISDDDDEVVAQAVPEAKPVPKSKPAPKAKPAKRKRVSQSTLNGWRDNCGCKYPQEYDTCNCQDYRDFLEWEKKCTCCVMDMDGCRCAARKAKKKE
jgi:hypothetical protein